jgi:hypothetical protein
MKALEITWPLFQFQRALATNSTSYHLDDGVVPEWHESVILNSRSTFEQQRTKTYKHE